MNREKWTEIGVRLGIAILAGAVIAAAVWAPLYFESQSLYYKFGGEKTMLQMGKSLGWLVLVLMAGQVILAARPALAVRAISLKRMAAWHKWGGVLVALLVLLHPLFILWADGFSLFPLELRYWPEFLGGLTALLLGGSILISLLRARMGLGYRLWQTLHRWGIPVSILLAFGHAFFVSETFHHMVPKTGLYLILVLILALLARIYIKRIFGGFLADGQKNKRR